MQHKRKYTKEWENTSTVWESIPDLFFQKFVVMITKIAATEMFI